MERVRLQYVSDIKQPVDGYFGITEFDLAVSILRYMEFGRQVFLRVVAVFPYPPDVFRYQLCFRIRQLFLFIARHVNDTYDKKQKADLPGYFDLIIRVVINDHGRQQRGHIERGLIARNDGFSPRVIPVYL